MKRAVWIALLWLMAAALVFTGSAGLAEDEVIQQLGSGSALLQFMMIMSGKCQLTNDIYISGPDLDIVYTSGELNKTYVLVKGACELDLNGKILDVGIYPIVISNGGSLTIKDSSTAKTGQIEFLPHPDNPPSNALSYIIQVGDPNTNGTLTLEEGNVFSVYNGIRVTSNGTVNIKGGTVTSAMESDNTDCAIENRAGGTVNISGGLVSANKNTIRNAGTLTITGGEVNATGDAAIVSGDENAPGGTVNVSGGTVSAHDRTVYLYGTKGAEGTEGGDHPSQFTMTGGTIASNGMLAIEVNDNSTVTMSGGTVTVADGTGIGLLSGTSTLNLSGGTIQAGGDYSNGVQAYCGGGTGSASFNLSGNPVFDLANPDDNADIEILDQTVITLGNLSPRTDLSPICVRVIEVTSTGDMIENVTRPFASGFTGEDPNDYFCPIQGKDVTLDADGNLAVAKYEVQELIDPDGIVVDFPQNLAYTGKQKTVTLSDLPEWVNLYVMYQRVTEEPEEPEEPTAQAPTEIGVYRITIHADESPDYYAAEWEYPDLLEIEEGHQIIVAEADKEKGLYAEVGDESKVYAASEGAPVFLIVEPVGNYEVTALSYSYTAGGEVYTEPLELQNDDSGEYYFFNMPDIDVTVNAEWGLTAPAFTDAALELGGVLNLRYYVEYPADWDGTNDWVEFTVNGGAPRTVTYSQSGTDSHGRYFPCPVNAYQMADLIDAVYYTGDNEEMDRIEDYSVRDNLLSLEETAEGNELDLVKALMDYGSYIQPYLAAVNGWTVGVDHEAMTPYNEALQPIGSVPDDYAISWNKNTEYVNKAQFALTLNAGTALNVRVTLQNGVSGAITGTVAGNQVTPRKVGTNVYQLTLSGIPANALCRPYTFTLSVDGAEVFDMRISALSYVWLVAPNTDDGAEKLALTALYNYATAAGN